ncbi:MAG: outer membrane protein assembly factor BamD [Acidobacteriota bacterium]
MKRLFSTLFAVAFIAAALLSTGCRSGFADDPILELSSQEALAEGKRLMQEEKFRRAQRYLEQAFEASPNSREGREALLLVADALYLRDSEEGYLRCEAKYRDFLNRFPTSERADYAQYQTANCLFSRMARPDRDQEVATQALGAYQELLRLYPTSDYIESAREKMSEVLENLAEAEFSVGAFYIRYRLCSAAITRFEQLPETFPSYSSQDKALYHLALAYANCLKIDEAREAVALLESDYPDSTWLAELDKIDDAIRDAEERKVEVDARRAERERLRAERQEAAEDEGSDPS